MSLAAVSNQHYNPHLPTYINDVLPKDNLRAIFARLSLDRQAVLPQVCKAWRAFYNDSETIKVILAKYDASYNAIGNGPKEILMIRLKNLKKLEASLESKHLTKIFSQSKTASFVSVHHKGNQILLLREDSCIIFHNPLGKILRNLKFDNLRFTALHVHEHNLYIGSQGGVIFLSRQRKNSDIYRRLYSSPEDLPITHLKVLRNVIFYTHSNDTRVRRYDHIARQVLPPIGNREQPITTFEIGSNRLFIAYLSEEPKSPLQIEEWDLRNGDPKVNSPIPLTAASNQSRINALCCLDNYLFVGEQTRGGRGHLRQVHILTRQHVFCRGFDRAIVGLAYRTSKLFVATPLDCKILIFPKIKTVAEKLKRFIPIASNFSFTSLQQESSAIPNSKAKRLKPSSNLN